MNQMKDIKEHKHILICGDNINSLNIARSLGEKGISPIVIMQQEDKPQLLASSRYVKEIIYVKGLKEALEKLRDFANDEYPPFVYITDDNHLQVLDAHYNQLKGKFIFFNAEEEGRLSYYLDKEKQCELAKKAGLSVPGYEEVERGQLPKALTYPVITKTSNSYSAGWKRDVAICYSPDELKEAYESMISERLLLQEYIEKTGEYSMQGISINGGEEVYMPFERMYLRFSKTSFGGYMYYQPFRNDDLQRKVQAMLKKIRFSGCFEIEFLVDKDNQLHFLEINLRFSASNYGVNNGGVNMPYLWAKSVLLNKIDTSVAATKQDRYYVMNEMEDISYAREVGWLKWLKQLITADGYYLYNCKDLKPFYAYWFGYKLKRVFKKIFGKQ